MISEFWLNKATNKGSDEQFQAYTRLWYSCLSQQFSEIHNGVGMCVFAHAAFNNGVMGGKTPYSGVPLTQYEHTIQHQKGFEYYNPIDWWVLQVELNLKNWIYDVEPPKKQPSKIKRVLGSAGHVRALLKYIIDYYKTHKRPLVMTLEPYTESRSVAQNNAQWFMYKQIEDAAKKDPDIIVRLLTLVATKQIDEMDGKSIKDLIHACFKILTNRKTTTKNYKHNDGRDDSWEEYAHDIVHISKEKLGVHIDMPDNKRGKK